MSSPAQLTCRDVGFAHGPHQVLRNVSLTIAPEDLIGIVGPNGSGKSTLLQLLAGRLAPATGHVVTMPADATVGFVPQVLADRHGDTIGSFLERETGIRAVLDEFDAAITAVGNGAEGADDRYDQALHRWARADAATFADRLPGTLDRVGLGRHPLERLTATLSGGERARLALALVTLVAFDVVLLDEPTNDLDIAGLELLEATLLGLDRAVAVVSHDRTFLANVTTAIVEVDEHERSVTRFNGGFDAWQAERQRAQAHHQRDYDEYQAKRANLADRARRQQQWAAQGRRKARTGDGETDKFIRAHRVATSERLAGKAKQTERALERLERNEAVDAPWKRWELRLDFGDVVRSGPNVASLHGATLSRGEPEAGGITLGPLDIGVNAGDRLLITGENGAGKTTVLDALLGELAPVSGTHRIGPSVVVGVLDQRRRRFDDGAPLLEAFGEAAGVDDATARSHLAKLGLDTTRLDRPAATLSPGEHTRAILGLFAATGVNLLVCDEPTNHLDLPAIEALEAALAAYPHTLILVTHDRRLIDNVTTNRHWRVTDGRVIEE